MNNIKTIIFDLGGVIIDLDVLKTIQQFSAFSGIPLTEVESLYHTHPSFLAFEKGMIGEATFRDEIRKIFHSETVADHAVDAAWNAMLIDLPRARLELLLSLKNKYKVIILSNTNTIHIDYVYTKMLPIMNASSFEPFVHNVYYSHRLGCRKPEPEIYRRVLDENDLKPEETIFLDDNPNNTKAAQALGIQVRHITHPDMVFEIFN